jgi:hypothetical protein
MTPPAYVKPQTHTDPLRTWAKTLIDKKPFKLVAVALANKLAARRALRTAC